MAKATAPIRSPRRIYKIPQLVRRITGEGESATSEVGDGYVNMKKAVAELFGDSLEELSYSDNVWYYTRTINGQEVQYRKNLGGYKFKQVKLFAYAGFDVNEQYYNDEGELTTESTNFKSITIGLPSGASLSRFLGWLELTDFFTSIDKIITPDGKPIFVNDVGGSEGGG